MPSQIISLSDGLLVEIDSQDGAPIADARESLERGIDQIKALLLKLSTPISEVLSTVGSNVKIEAVEVDVGLSFEVEGNLYIAKSKAGAHLDVKLKFKPA